MKQQIYVVIIEDRHEAIKLHVYTDAQIAVREARRIAHELCVCSDDYEEFELNSNLRAAGWLFSVAYSCEGDGIGVVRTSVNDEVAVGEGVGD